MRNLGFLVNYMVYSKKNIFWSSIISGLLYPYFSFFNFFRRKHNLDNLEIKRILVTEYHRIGDVLIIIQALNSIKKRFPKSHLILICNSSVEKLAKHLNLADEVIPITVPWTNWNWSLFDWYKTRSFAKSFSKKNIDLAFDFKGDFRNSWFLWNTYPKVSFGYNTTGGGYFFTNPQTMNQDLHQSERAEALVSIVGCIPVKEQFDKININEHGAVVIHVGATDPKRSWPIKCWIDLIKLLSDKFTITVVETIESEPLIEQLNEQKIEVGRFKGDLIELKNWLINQRCLVAPDSMAGHLAAYVQIPVISIFGSQDPKLTRPVIKLGAIVQPDKPCNHSSNHWRFCRKCMESIQPLKVCEAVCKEIN